MLNIVISDIAYFEVSSAYLRLEISRLRHGMSAADTHFGFLRRRFIRRSRCRRRASRFHDWLERRQPYASIFRRLSPPGDFAAIAAASAADFSFSVPSLITFIAFSAFIAMRLSGCLFHLHIEALRLPNSHRRHIGLKAPGWLFHFATLMDIAAID